MVAVTCCVVIYVDTYRGHDIVSQSPRSLESNHGHCKCAELDKRTYTEVAVAVTLAVFVAVTL